MKRPCALGAAALVGAIGVALALMNYLADRADEKLDAVNPFGGDEVPDSAPATAEVSVGSDAGATETPDTSSMTKAELYEKATELGVKGRSKMSKAELAAAIEKVS